MIKFRLSLTALDNLALPAYKGSTFRGGFGHAFKRVVCALRKEDCRDCLLKGKCIYSYVFETPPPEGSQILSKYEKAPHPFIIEPPIETKTRYAAGDALDFNLILIGKAVDYLPYFVYTFEELGKIGIGKGKGRYSLEKVKSIAGADALIGLHEEVIYSAENRVLKGDFRCPKISDHINTSKHNPSDSKLITLNFLTPARMVFNEDLVVDLEFHQLIRTLLRRLSSLSYFHFGERLELDFKGIIERAQNVGVKKRDTSWHDWERYSARQDTRMKMGGFVGKVTFEGDMNEFMPFIELGELLHVGKGTSFGLGRYEIDGNGTFGKRALQGNDEKQL